MDFSRPTRVPPQSWASLLPAAGGLAGLLALLITLLNHGPSRLSAQVAGGPGGRPGPGALAAAPWLLPFQGRLTTSDGKPLTEGETTAVFALYDAPTGGAAVWSSGPLKLKVGPGGLVHATLGGEANPLEGKADFSREVYLGVKVDDPSNTTPASDEPEMLPRVRIVPALFAIRSKMAEDSYSVRGINVFDHVVPTGTVLPFAGVRPPSGWLTCEGQVLDLEKNPEYKKLADIIGTQFDPSKQSIRLPDLRGRVPIGLGEGNGLSKRLLGDTGGEEAHVLSLDEMPSHNHGINDPGHTHGIQLGNNTAEGPDTWVQHSDDKGGNWGVIQTAGSATNISIKEAGGGKAHNVLPPYCVINFIIKFN